MRKIRVIAAETHTSEYLLHKYWARKPHNVLSELIKELVPQGGIIVDPFCGSGVVLHEAQKLGYTVYGFDINPIACLISRVLTSPPDSKIFSQTVTRILDEISEEISSSYSENGQQIKYCVHSIIAKCPDCGQVQSQSEATSSGKNLLCSKCGSKLRFNLEHLVSTEITAIAYENSKELDTSTELLDNQQIKSSRIVFEQDNTKYTFSFAENRRILAYNGMNTQHLFTARNFSILCYIANQFSKIEDDKVRDAAMLLLSASVAQCSRLIANRNNLSTGGPAWSIPGFWVPAIHLETNPLVHLRARLQKFNRGLEALTANQYEGVVIIEKIDSRIGLANLSNNGVHSDLVFFDPPYGDNVPYVEFSSMWNSFLNDFPNPDSDISVSDRLSKIDAWDRYNHDLSSSIRAIHDNLKPNGRILITFNNNDMRAWKALLSSLQSNHFSCECVTYQIPAVVSSKAQKSIKGSYISDIYSVYKKVKNKTVSTSLTPVSEDLIACAKYRGGRISKALAHRTMIISWIKNNISVSLLDEMTSIQNSIFYEENEMLYLKSYDFPSVSPFENDARRLASEILDQGPCEWKTLYEKIAASVANYEIPDPHELKAVLEGFVTFDNNRCIACVPVPEQLSIFDIIKEIPN